jgi:hypothetical protein
LRFECSVLEVATRVGLTVAELAFLASYSARTVGAAIGVGFAEVP